MHLGIDLDNTLVCYDQVFYHLARERGLIPAGLAQRKQAVRDHIRSLPDGEAQWIAIQGTVYGDRMSEAILSEGVEETLCFCRDNGIPVSIISHKTHFPVRGRQTDLWREARRWMESQGFFDRNRFAIDGSNVFLEPTRVDKLTRIGLCGCTHYVDDLPEVLLDPVFPAAVKRFWYSAGEGGNQHAGHAFSSGGWDEVLVWVRSAFQQHAGEAAQ